MKLQDMAIARSGDKGNRATLSVIARDLAHYPLLEQLLTAERVADRCSTHARGAHYTHTRRLRPRSSRGSSSAHARALLVLARLRSCPLTIDPECSEQRTQAVCALLLSSTPLEWRRFPPLEPKLQAVRAGLQILRFLAIRTCKRAANALRETSP